MNRESLVEVVLGITVAMVLMLLVAGLRGAKDSSSTVEGRGRGLSILVYVSIGLSVLVTGGTTAAGVAGLLAVIGAPLLALSWWRRNRGAVPSAGSDGPGLTLQRLTASALAATMLVAGAETLALFGHVDPRAVVLVMSAVGALVLVWSGPQARTRISVLVLCAAVVPVLGSLALGGLLGGLGTVVEPIVPVSGLTTGAWVGLGVTVVVLVLADPALRDAPTSRTGVWGTVAGAVVPVVVLCGALMALGGSLVMSMHLVTVPANLDLVPGLLGVVLGVVTIVVLGAVVAVFARGLAPTRDASQPEDDAGEASAPRVASVALCTGLAGALALSGLGIGQVAVLAGLLAAARLGSDSTAGARRPTTAVALATVAVATTALALGAALEPGWWSAGATVAVAALTWALPRRWPSASQPTSLSAEVVRGHAPGLP